MVDGASLISISFNPPHTRTCVFVKKTARTGRCRTWTRSSRTTKSSSRTGPTRSWAGGRRSGCWCTGSATLSRPRWRRRAGGGSGDGGGSAWRGSRPGGLLSTTRRSGCRPLCRCPRRRSGTRPGLSTPSAMSARATRGASLGAWMGVASPNKCHVHTERNGTDACRLVSISSHNRVCVRACASSTTSSPQRLPGPRRVLHPHPRPPGRSPRRRGHAHHADGAAGPHPALGLRQDGGAHGDAPPPHAAGEREGERAARPARPARVRGRPDDARSNTRVCLMILA